MPTAQDRGWGNPDAAGYRQQHIVGVQAGGVTLYVRREVAHLFMGFLQDVVFRGYPLKVRADDWGYINRDIRGRPGVKSNHSWGLAIDINATTNPMSDQLVTDMPSWMPDVAAKWGLTWGGSYRGRKDPMHFEFLGTPADVAKYPLRTEEDDMTPEEHAWLGRIHHEVAANDKSAKTVTMMLQEILDRLTALEAKP